MHRDLQSNMPLRIYEFSRHLEITNAGGLYGNARPENFPTINDYRNPLIASVMKTMGYVNMFNRGVGQVQADLKENGNDPAIFDVNLLTAFKVIVNEVSGESLKNDRKNDVENMDFIKEFIKNFIKEKAIQLSERPEKILLLIATEPTMTSQKISQKTSVSQRTILKDLTDLQNKGIVSREGGRKSGKWVIADGK